MGSTNFAVVVVLFWVFLVFFGFFFLGGRIFVWFGCLCLIFLFLFLFSADQVSKT